MWVFRALVQEPSSLNPPSRSGFLHSFVHCKLYSVPVTGVQRLNFSRALIKLLKVMSPQKINKSQSFRILFGNRSLLSALKYEALLELINPVES